MRLIFKNEIPQISGLQKYRQLTRIRQELEISMKTYIFHFICLLVSNNDTGCWEKCVCQFRKNNTTKNTENTGINFYNAMVIPLINNAIGKRRIPRENTYRVITLTVLLVHQAHCKILVTVYHHRLLWNSDVVAVLPFKYFSSNWDLMYDYIMI